MTIWNSHSPLLSVGSPWTLEPTMPHTAFPWPSPQSGRGRSYGPCFKKSCRHAGFRTGNRKQRVHPLYAHLLPKSRRSHDCNKIEETGHEPEEYGRTVTVSGRAADRCTPSMGASATGTIDNHLDLAQRVFQGFRRRSRYAGFMETPRGGQTPDFRFNRLRTIKRGRSFRKIRTTSYARLLA